VSDSYFVYRMVPDCSVVLGHVRMMASDSDHSFAACQEVSIDHLGCIGPLSPSSVEPDYDRAKANLFCLQGNQH